MKDLNKITLRAKDFTPTNDLLKIDSVNDLDEAAKLIKKLQMAVIYQNEVINLYEEKIDGLTPKKDKKKQ